MAARGSQGPFFSATSQHIKPSRAIASKGVNGGADQPRHGAGTQASATCWGQAATQGRVRQRSSGECQQHKQGNQFEVGRHHWARAKRSVLFLKKKFFQGHPLLTHKAWIRQPQCANHASGQAVRPSLTLSHKATPAHREPQRGQTRQQLSGKHILQLGFRVWQGSTPSCYRSSNSLHRHSKTAAPALEKGNATTATCGLQAAAPNARQANSMRLRQQVQAAQIPPIPTDAGDMQAQPHTPTLAESPAEPCKGSRQHKQRRAEESNQR